MKNLRTNRGFTFIEVLVAMLIFVLAGLATVDIGRGSVKATKDAKDVSQATWLLQSVIVQAETRLETEGVEKGCEKKKEGKFEAPNQGFSWLTTCEEIDFHLSETAANLAKQANGDDKQSSNATQENLIEKMILQTASDYLTKSIREVHAEVNWLQGKNKRVVTVTTHFARYDQPLQLPGLGGGTSTSTGGSGSSGTSGTGGKP